MSRFSSIVWSSVGEKNFLTGITGLLLMCVSFLNTCRATSYSFTTIPHPFNRYAHWLHSLGEVLIIVELGTRHNFLSSISSWGYRSPFARRMPVPGGCGITKPAGAGNPSRKSLSSVSMVVTGLVLLIFVIVHLKMFKFGPWCRSRIR